MPELYLGAPVRGKARLLRGEKNAEAKRLGLVQPWAHFAVEKHNVSNVSKNLQVVAGFGGIANNNDKSIQWHEHKDAHQQ